MSDPAAPEVRPLADVKATEAFATELARRLPPGAVLLLDGPLGAGKTTLARALIRACGGPVDATSPTYALIHEYPTPAGPIGHADAYRLADPNELLDLGLLDLFERARLVIIEWGAPFAELRPDAWRVTLQRDSAHDSGRVALLLPPGMPPPAAGR